MHTFNFSLEHIIEFSWSKFKEKPFFWIVIFTCILLAQNIIDSKLGPLITMIDIKTMVVSFNHDTRRIIFEFILLYFSTSIIKTTIQFMQGKNVDYRMLLNLELKVFICYLLGLFFMGFIIGVGLMLFIFPGLYLAVRLIFVPYLIIDGNTSIVYVFKKSWLMTHGNEWKICLFILTITGVLLIAEMFGQIVPLFGQIVPLVVISFLSLVKAYFYVNFLKD